MRQHLTLFINGARHDVADENAFLPLSTYLRQVRGATGTKVVCEEGDCGACTVLLGTLNSTGLSYRPINSCIQFLYQLDCTHIITVEGLKQNGQHNPVQECMVQCHGAQCGFCTPGIVMAMSAMFHDKAPRCEQDVKDALTGNLCRCTGYEPIIKSALAVDPAQMKTPDELYAEATPTIIVELGKLKESSVRLQSSEHVLYVPHNLEQALKIKSENPEAIPVAGGTDICVYWNKRGIEPAALLSLAHIDELKNLRIDEQTIRVGASVTLAALEDLVQTRVPEFARILHLFGSPQIRNAGTLAGNVANASPIADSPPFLAVMDAEIELASARGRRRVNINQFYKGYKKLDMQPDELIVRIDIPMPAENEILKLYKVSRRKHLDISAFNAAVRMSIDGNIIEHIAIAYGGVAPTLVRLPKTEAFLQGKQFTLDNCRAAGTIARGEIAPISDVRGSSDFRLTLAENILEKLYFDISEREAIACHR